LPFCRKIASTRAFFGAATPFHFPRRRNPINCTLARGRNGLFAPLEVLGISWRAASKRWTCAIQCEFARLNFSTSASSSRRRGIFDSRAKYTYSCVPDCYALATRNRNWEKCRRFAVTFSKCRWKVLGTRRIFE